MAMDTDDGARTVAYDIPGFFQSIYPSGQLSSSDKCPLDDIQTYCIQPLRFPPNSRKFKRSSQVDGHLERRALSQSELAIKVVRETHWQYRLWMSSATVRKSGSCTRLGREEKKPDVIIAATKIRDIEEAENTRDSARTRSVHT